MELPLGAQVVSVIEQNGKIMLYAICDEMERMERRDLLVVGTGWKIDLTDWPRVEPIGTVKVDPFVWHVLEVHDLPF
ncbi:DUF7352 domain-containing protein [Paenibacillus cymbidii]|uniref:DUF7352 domain-containing protein n=1 Tax=Paenibacillus cymbidii TaxID=1639034 RepID=UPI0010802CE4|nr:hypothetical protein [Paenibacillus cymbidii]